MGGMGFISKDPATILRNNSLISMQTLEAARLAGVSRFFFASSACIYPEYAQAHHDVAPLREADAYPAQPQDSYGWEKLMTERLCAYYTEQYGLETRIARYHNVYGPFGAFEGGREKAPAAICRKVASAPAGGEVEVWGDGLQTRSFCYVDDCVEGTYKLMRSDHREPVNIGSDYLINVNDLARLVMEIADRSDLRIVSIPGPEGVRGRNSDNTLVRAVLGWQPRISLRDGMTETYRWVAEQVRDQQARSEHSVAGR
jgi:nucleoside-diphosphate-sugar epimerase